MEDNNSSSSGIGFFGLLTVLFIGLKLTHYIDWSWWWILAPTWIPMTIAISVSLILILAAIYIENRGKKR